MTVVGLHPEELFDKLLDGELTPAERERLQLHLQACDVCRFEYAARGDFQAEALALPANGPPPLSPLRTPLPLPSVATAPAVRVRRRRSRLVVWGLAAAALITASGAVAAGVVGHTPWHSVSRLFSQASAPTLQSPPARQPPPAAPVPAMPTEAPPQVQPASAALALAPARPDSQARHPERAQIAAVRAAHGQHAPVTVLAKEPPFKDPVTTEPVVKEPASSAKLFAEANQARRSGDIGRASGLYRLLQDQFAGSAEAELSRVTLALLLLDSGDAQGALVGFERYLAGASQGLEAEALVGRARALGRLGRRDLEASAWQEVQRKYPRSIYGRQASERLSALGLP